MASAKLYSQFIAANGHKEVDLNSDQLKVMLLDSGYVPNQDTHKYKSDLSHEVAGTGYTAGGLVLTGVALTYDSSTKTFKLTANPASWNPSTITARYAVVYDNSPGTDSARPLICYFDFITDQSSSGDEFTLTFGPSGIVQWVVS